MMQKRLEGTWVTSSFIHFLFDIFIFFNRYLVKVYYVSVILSDTWLYIRQKCLTSWSLHLGGEKNKQNKYIKFVVC